MRMLIVALVFSLPAAAQTRAAKKAEPPPKAQHIEIDDADEVWGENATGQGEILLLNRRARFLGLIKVRQDFKAEMMNTASGL
jgi:hypothetical protein